MDPFKILVSGTSLEKSYSLGKSLFPKPLPSEGAIVRPQALSDAKPENTTDGSNAQGRGVKRKRRADKDGTSKVQPKNEEEGNHSLFQPKTEEQCRKLLKLHKLKISVLSDLPAKTKLPKNGKKSFLQVTSQPLESFRDLSPWFKASRRLTENVANQGYTVPTEVQLGSIPLLLGTDDDRGLSDLTHDRSRADVDLLTVAPTGSGKTLAFLTPLIQGILDQRASEGSKDGSDKQERYVRALVLAPTHELVEQTVNEARKLVAGTGLKVSAMRKGARIFQADLHDDEQDESSGGWIKSDVVVSTPLMLQHSLSSDSAEAARNLPSIASLVLDEADVLLDPLFRDQTLAIWNSCTNPALRVSLWSATIGSSIETIAKSIILDRRKRLGLSLDNHFILRLIVGLKDSALPSISHRLMYTATEQGKLLAMRQILHPSSAEASSNIPTLPPPFLVFTQTIQRAKALHSELLYDIPPEAGGSSRIAVLHSQLSESARSDAMAGFRRREIWVLVTTDLLARGVDFRGVNGVVNYDIPNTSAAYVHRAGRTGRAGREGGTAVTLYTKEDIPYVRNIVNVIAASEKQYGKKEGESDVPKWLLDALPPVSKNTKKDLKRQGVAARRPGLSTDDPEVRRMRISTKSGYDRRNENKRRGATKGKKGSAKGLEYDDGHDISESDGWSGFKN